MKQLLLLTVMTASAGQGTVWAGDNVWTSLGPDGGTARSLVVDPNTPSTLYVVTSAGLYKSTDGGASWNVTPPLPPNSGVINYLVIDPRNRSTLYGATRGASSGGSELARIEIRRSVRTASPAARRPTRRTFSPAGN